MPVGIGRKALYVVKQGVGRRLCWWVVGPIISYHIFIYLYNLLIILTRINIECSNDLTLERKSAQEIGKMCLHVSAWI